MPMYFWLYSAICAQNNQKSVRARASAALCRVRTIRLSEITQHCGWNRRVSAHLLQIVKEASARDSRPNTHTRGRDAPSRWTERLAYRGCEQCDDGH